MRVFVCECVECSCMCHLPCIAPNHLSIAIAQVHVHDDFYSLGAVYRCWPSHTHQHKHRERERARTKRREAVETHAQLTHKQTRTCGIDGNIRMLFYSSIFRTSTQRTCEWVCTWHVLCICVCACVMSNQVDSVRCLCVVECCFHFFPPWLGQYAQYHIDVSVSLTH